MQPWFLLSSRLGPRNAILKIKSNFHEGTGRLWELIMAHRAFCLWKSLVQIEVKLWLIFAPLWWLLVIWSVTWIGPSQLLSASSQLAQSQLFYLPDTAGLWGQWWRWGGQWLLCHCWIFGLLPFDQGGSYTLGSITKLHCSYYTISMAVREFNCPLLSAKQLSVRLKINLKPMLFPPPHTQYIFTYTKNPNPKHD